MVNSKIGIIGAGDIGFNLAEILALQGYQVKIYNRSHEENGAPSAYWLAKMGKIMDLSDALQLTNCGEVSLTSELDTLKEVDYLIITAGAKRASTEETREDLAVKNAKILEGYLGLIAQSNALVMVLTNPVDFLTAYLINKITEKKLLTLEQARERIVGVSYVDTMRLKNLVKELLKSKKPEICCPKIEALVIGEHGPAMVPLMSAVEINNLVISEIFQPEEINKIAEQTILRGNDIIKLTGASSIKGPAHAAMHMVTKIDNADSINLPCSYFSDGIAIGQLVTFTGRRAKLIVPIGMAKEEAERFAASCAAIKNQMEKINSLLS